MLLFKSGKQTFEYLFVEEPSDYATKWLGSRMTPEEANHKFGFLLGAFEYGAPLHGGIAFGFDRLCALLGGSESIRDFIAFPKNNSGRDVMLDAPSSIDDKQFEELHIKLNLK